MSLQASLWQPLDAAVSVVSAAFALKIELLPAGYGQLRLRCREGEFPAGELLLICANWPQTRHWCVPASAEHGVLTAALDGAEAAYDPEDHRPLQLCLARRTEQGLEQFPLQAPVSPSRLTPSSRCLYLFDDRDLWGSPAASFFRQGTLCEALPHYIRTTKKTVTLGLSLLPRSLRYWEQLSYSVEEMAVRERQIFLSARGPEGAPVLDGFVLHRGDWETPEARYIPGKQADGRCLGTFGQELLPLEGDRWVLSGVLKGEDEISYYIPLSVTDARTHQVLELLANGSVLRQEGERQCYLEVDDLCHLAFLTGTEPPACQRLDGIRSLRQALRQELLPVKGHCAIRDLGGKDWHWRLELPGYELSARDELVLLARQKSEQYILPVELISCTAGRSLLSADFSALAAGLQNSLVTNWDLTLALRQGQFYSHMKLRLPLQTIRRRLNTDTRFLNYSSAYNAPIGSIPLGAQTVEALICCPADGYCQLQTADRLRRYEWQMACRAEQASLRGSRLHLRIACPASAPGRWTCFALSYRYKLEPDRKLFFFPARQVQQRGDTVWMSADADLSQFRFSQLFWDIRAVFESEDGVRRLVRIRPAPKKKARSKTRRRLEQLKQTLLADSYRQGEDLSVSLYTTAYGQLALVCQEYTPYSGLAFRLKEQLALRLYKWFRGPLSRKNIFLCYEKYCCMAQDNGFYFFQYCMEHDMERKMNRSIYFVIDKKQRDFQERLLPYRDHVIQFMSLRHMVYLLAARLLISSDAKPHAYVWRSKESLILPRILAEKKLVFLQHGVIALKRVEFFSKGPGAANLFITSNQREHDIIVNELGYAPEDVVITGLARWDVLRDRGLAQRRILVMPTWRNWLEEVSDLTFMTSDYYHHYMSLLNDDRLARLLEEQDLYLDFYIHPKFRTYLSSFAISGGNRVRLIPFGTEPLNQLIMGCKLLITDYSSVCWDVYYQGKPVLFYQFDVKQYNETTGAYIDMDTELFGDRVMTTEELLDQLEAYARDDFRLPERYAALRPKMYAYLDHSNSQRTCEEIMKRKW